MHACFSNLRRKLLSLPWSVFSLKRNCSLFWFEWDSNYLTLNKKGPKLECTWESITLKNEGYHNTWLILNPMFYQEQETKNQICRHQWNKSTCLKRVRFEFDSVGKRESLIDLLVSEWLLIELMAAYTRKSMPTNLSLIN